MTLFKRMLRGSQKPKSKMPRSNPAHYNGLDIETVSALVDQALDIEPSRHDPTPSHDYGSSDSGSSDGGSCGGSD